jgi:phage/plasmid-like protein (TIGR03299 family)
MSAEVESMAWATTVPWHGLGVQVDPSESVDHWVHMAGIDWEVEMQPVHLADGTVVPNHMALVRKTDRTIYDVCGDRWVPHQNRQIAEFFKAFVAPGGGQMETLGSLKGGRVVWGLASLNDKFQTTSGDVVKGYLLMAVHHILGRAAVAKVTGVRVVCANTMAMALGESSQIEARFNHDGKFSVDAAVEAMGLAREDFVKFGRIARQLVKLKLSQDDVVRILQPILDPQNGPETDDAGLSSVAEMQAWAAAYEPNRVVEGVLESYQNAPGATPGNAWGLLNGLTHYADHVARGDKDSRLASAWLGNYARKKQVLLDKLVQLVD